MNKTDIFNVSAGQKTLFWLIYANIIKALSQWILLTVIIKFFTDTEVGYYNLGIAIAAPFFSLSGMQLKSILVVEPSKEKNDFPTYLLIRHITVFLVTIILILYCVFFSKINWILVYVFIYKGIENLIDILYGYLQKEDKMIWMSKSEIWKSVVTAIIFILITCIFRNIKLSQLALVTVMVIFYLINLFYTLHLMGTNIAQITFPNIASIILKGFPLGISVFLSSYIINYPRLAIESFMGTEMLAYFGSFSYVAIGLFEVITPVLTFLRQRLSKHFQEGDVINFTSKVKKTVRGICILGLIYYTGLFLLGSFFIKLLFNESYIQYSSVLYLLIGGQILSSVAGVFSTAVLSFNVYTKQAIISAGVLVTVIVFSRILIEPYGFYGAGLIHVIASAISLFMYYAIYCKRVYKWKKSK